MYIYFKSVGIDRHEHIGPISDLEPVPYRNRTLSGTDYAYMIRYRFYNFGKKMVFGYSVEVPENLEKEKKKKTKNKS